MFGGAKKTLYVYMHGKQMLTKCFSIKMHVLLGKVAQSSLLGASQNCHPLAGGVDPRKAGDISGGSCCGARVGRRKCLGKESWD